MHDDCIYVFGGGDGPHYYNHLYKFDTASLIWSSPTTSGPCPSPRRAHVSVVWRGNMYIFGGGDGIHALNDTYSYDIQNKTWQLMETTGPKPEPRGYHSGTLVGEKLVVYGGSDGHTCFGDVYLLDLPSNSWHRVKLDPQVPRLSHAPVCVGSYLFVTGGHDGSHYCNDLLMLNFVTMLGKFAGYMGTPQLHEAITPWYYMTAGCLSLVDMMASTFSTMFLFLISAPTLIFPRSPTLL